MSVRNLNVGAVTARPTILNGINVCTIEGVIIMKLKLRPVPWRRLVSGGGGSNLSFSLMGPRPLLSHLK